MATHFNPRSSQAPARPKGFFQKVGETFGQLFGFNAGPVKKAEVRQRDFYGPATYSERVPKALGVICNGKVRAAEKTKVPDSQLLPFLDQIRNV